MAGEVKVKVTADMDEATRAIQDYKREAEKLQRELNNLQQSRHAPPVSGEPTISRPTSTRGAGTTGVSSRGRAGKAGGGTGSFGVDEGLVTEIGTDRRNMGLETGGSRSRMEQSQKQIEDLIKKGQKTRNQLGKADYRILQEQMRLLPMLAGKHTEQLMKNVSKGERDVAKLRLTIAKTHNEDARKIYQQELDAIVRQTEKFKQELTETHGINTDYEQRNQDLGEAAGNITQSNNPMSEGSALLTQLGGIAAVIGILNKINNELKQSGQRAINKEVSIWDSAGRVGAFGADSVAMRKGFQNQQSRAMGYTADETAQYVDAYMKAAGYNGNINDTIESAVEHQRISRAYGIDAATTANIGGTFTQRGVFDDSAVGQRKFASMLAGSIDSGDMAGREEEQLKVLEELLRITEDKKLGVSEDQYASTYGLYRMLTDGNDKLKGSRGSDMVGTLDEAIKNTSDVHMLRAMGFGQEGMTNIEGYNKAVRQMEKGVSDPENLKKLFEYFDQFQGENGKDSRWYALVEDFFRGRGLNGSQIDEIFANEDKIRSGDYSLTLEQDTNAAINSIDRNLNNYINSQVGKDKANEIAKDEAMETAGDVRRDITRPFNDLWGGMSDEARAGLTIGGGVAGTVAGAKIIGGAVAGGKAAAAAGGSVLGGAAGGAGSAIGGIATTAGPIAAVLAAQQLFSSGGVGFLDWFKSQDTHKQEAYDWVDQYTNDAANLGFSPELLEKVQSSGMVDNIYDILGEKGYSTGDINGARFSNAEGLAAKDKIGKDKLSEALTPEEQAALWLRKSESNAYFVNYAQDQPGGRWAGAEEIVTAAQLRQAMLDYYKTPEGQQYILRAMQMVYDGSGSFSEESLISLFSIRDESGVSYKGTQQDVDEVLKHIFGGDYSRSDGLFGHSGRMSESSLNDWWKGNSSSISDTEKSLSGDTGISTGDMQDYIKGSYATGNDYIPFDNYLANLHKGEAVLTKPEADVWRRQNTSNTGGLAPTASSPAKTVNLDDVKSIADMDYSTQELTADNLSEREKLIREESALLDRMYGAGKGVDTMWGMQRDTYAAASASGSTSGNPISNWFNGLFGGGNSGSGTGSSYQYNGGQAGVQDGAYNANTPMRRQESQQYTAAQLNALIEKNVAGRESVMLGQGQAILDAAKATGISPIDILSQAALETGWGTSNIAKDKNNFFGIGAYDTDPYNGAKIWANPYDGLTQGAAWIAENYVDRGQDTFYRLHHASEVSGVEDWHNYATDPNYSTSLSGMRNSIYRGLENIPAHATGKDYVPYNNYFMAAHQGEAVLTANEASEWRNTRTRDFSGIGSLSMNSGELVVRVVVQGGVDGVNERDNGRLISSLQASLSGTIPTRLMDYLSYNKETTAR